MEERAVAQNSQSKAKPGPSMADLHHALATLDPAHRVGNGGRGGCGAHPSRAGASGFSAKRARMSGGKSS